MKIKKPSSHFRKGYWKNRVYSWYLSYKKSSNNKLRFEDYIRNTIYKKKD